MSEESNDYKLGYIYAYDEIKRAPEQIEYLEALTLRSSHDFDLGMNEAIRDLTTYC